MDNLYNFLAAIPLFSHIQSAQLKAFLNAASCGTRTYSKNSIIHMENERCEAMEILVSGIVSVQNLDDEGNIMTITELHRGETLGANLIFSARPLYPMMIYAKTDTSLFLLKKKVILDLCREYPPFLSRFLQEISDKALVLTGKIKTISTKSLRQNICDYLVFESRLRKNNTIHLPFSKKEWAELLGVQRPSLSRELDRMRQEGLIQFKNREIRILKDLL